MSAGTAIAVLLSSTALALQRDRSATARRAGQMAAFALLLLSLITACVHVLHARANEGGSDMVNPLQMGHMSRLTVASLLLLALTTLFIRARRRLGSLVVDAITLLACLVAVMIVAGYVYGAMQLLQLSAATQTPLPTVAALALLTFVVFSRRAEHGVFSVLTGTGIGSRIARVICPSAFLLPFLRETIRAWTIHKGWTVPEYSTVIATAVASMLAFMLILLMALRISTLEKRLHELSLCDSLTDLYNRRGFYLFAEQALWLAQRAQKPFSVLYIDLDDLKKINDEQGHEVGSAFIVEVAGLLQKTFRETDAVGRIGGDEFAIAGDWDLTGMLLAAQRLEAGLIQINGQPDREYRISFSMGQVTLEPGQDETLERLLARADEAMYKIKQQKKAHSLQTALHPE